MRDNQRVSVWLEEGAADLAALVQEEARLVDRAIKSAAAAFKERDVAAAEAVIVADDAIDECFVGIEEGVQALLARQAPVASDLRRVLATLHVNLHLERIADYCVTVAKLVRLTADLPLDPALEAAFERMAERAAEIVAVAVDSFFAADVAAARALVDLDEQIDAENRRVVARVVGLEQGRAQREWAVWMVLVSRCLERIGDHAVDIGEQTAYLASGVFHEFTDASHPFGDAARADLSP